MVIKHQKMPPHIFLPLIPKSTHSINGLLFSLRRKGEEFVAVLIGLYIVATHHGPLVHWEYSLGVITCRLKAEGDWIYSWAIFNTKWNRFLEGILIWADINRNYNTFFHIFNNIKIIATIVKWNDRPMLQPGNGQTAFCQTTRHECQVICQQFACSW